MVSIIDCDFSNREHREAIIELMNDYMADKMGGNRPPYNDKTAQKVLTGLEKHPSKLVLLAKYDDRFVGLANCFINFGTFAGRPFINIHDIVVLKSFRGRQVGLRLMESISHRAQELDCSKITLEVRDDNTYAQKLYKKLGYREDKPPMHFWTKYL